MMNVPIQFQYSPNSHPAAPAGYWRPGMSASELNTAARKDREAGKRVLDEHERKLDALFAETRQLTASKWGNDHHGGVPKPRLIGFRAKHGHLFGDAPAASKTSRWDAFRAKHGHLFGDAPAASKTSRWDAFRAKHGHLFGDAPAASKTPRREPPRSLESRAALAKVRLHEARIAEREAADKARRADDALAKSLEPPLPVYLLDVEPIDFIGKEPCQLEKTWSNGERRWITYEWTDFGEKALAEGRYHP